MLKVRALTRRRCTCDVGTLVTGEIFVVLSNERWGGSAALLLPLHILCLDPDQSPQMTNVLLSQLQQTQRHSGWGVLGKLDMDD